MRKLAATILFLMSAPSLSAGEILCEFEQSKGNFGWIAPEIRISLDEYGETAKVNDAVIRDYWGRPVTASVLENSPQRLVLSWLLRSKETGRPFVGEGNVAQYVRKSKLDFRLILWKNSGEAKVTVPAWANVSDRVAKGLCKAVN